MKRSISDQQEVKDLWQEIPFFFFFKVFFVGRRYLRFDQIFQLHPGREGAGGVVRELAEASALNALRPSDPSSASSSASPLADISLTQRGVT